MTAKELEKFSKQRDELIGSLIASMDKQVSENQKKFLERFLEKFVDKLEKDEDGNILNNSNNRKLLVEIDEVFKDYQKKEAVTTITLLLQSVNAIVNFNKEYFTAVDGKAKVLPLIPKVKDFMKVWLGIKGDKLEPNGYIDKLISNRKTVLFLPARIN